MTGTDTSTFTQTTTATYTPTPSFTRTQTPSRTLTLTITSTLTFTPTETQSQTGTITPTYTITQTWTPLPTPNIDKVLDRNYVDAGKGEVLNVKVRAAANRLVNVKIYNLTGELVRTFEFTTAAAGWNQAPWDLKNNAGKIVGEGIYFLRIEADGASAIRKVYILK
jgi:hypothetical protein